MAASFQQLRGLLEQFEQEQFDALCCRRVDGSLNGVAHGGVQFVSIERARSTVRTKADAHKGCRIPGDEMVLPVVIGIGINYCQQRENATFPKLNRWLRDKECGLPTIIDHEPHMRRAADLAIAAYHRNTRAWSEPFEGRPAHAENVPPIADYILIATNFSPLITIKQWTKHTTAERAALMGAATVDLNRFIKLVESTVDLWIGHGRLHWERFDALRQETGAMPNWMVTYNLSGLGAGNMIQRQNAGHPLYR